MSFLNRNVFMVVLVVICGLTIRKPCEAVDLPPGLTQCHAGDVSCIKDAIQFVLRNYSDGYAGIGLHNIKEVNLTDVTVSKAGGDSPVQMNLKFDSMSVYGLENMTVERVVGFGQDLSTTKFELYFLAPRLIVDFVHVIDGKVLLLPLSGRGKGHLEMGKVKMSVKIKARENNIQRDGKMFVKLQKVKALIVPETLHVNFDNLFNGNDELGQTMNNLINNNWRDIWSELEEGINNAMADSVKQIIASVTDTLPYTDFYVNSESEK